jgi:hypothetical protein
MSLKQELAEYRAGWFKRVPAERQAIMERHIAQLRNGLAIARRRLFLVTPEAIPSMSGRS